MRHTVRYGGIISIHALREEGDSSASCSCGVLSVFLSTPSARRATGFGKTRSGGICYFYPRPPRGGRQKLVQCSGSVEVFLSTPSARRATAKIFAASSGSYNFYPRPPRGGRRAVFVEFGDIVPFLSTPSARRATRNSSRAFAPTLFLSTPSARRATLEIEQKTKGKEISIHALREEGDRKAHSR